MVPSTDDPVIERPSSHYPVDDDLPPSMAVLDAVADARECELTALAPLYDVVDPDALDALGSGDEPASDPLSVSFNYGGSLITVEYGPQLTVVVGEEPST